ncbi:MAG: transposase [Chloroflexi bacterium]|nr:transposase [Chloroflexota bacterium]
MTEQEKKTYTAEFKGEAVGLVIDHGYSIAEGSKCLWAFRSG